MSSFICLFYNQKSLFPMATILNDGFRSAKAGKGFLIISWIKEVIRAKSRGAELIEKSILEHCCVLSTIPWNNYQRLTCSAKIHLFINSTEKLFQVILAWNLLNTDKDGNLGIGGPASYDFSIVHSSSSLDAVWQWFLFFAMVDIISKCETRLRY